MPFEIHLLDFIQHYFLNLMLHPMQITNLSCKMLSLIIIRLLETVKFKLFLFLDLIWTWWESGGGVEGWELTGKWGCCNGHTDDLPIAVQPSRSRVYCQCNME